MKQTMVLIAFSLAAWIAAPEFAAAQDPAAGQNAAVNNQAASPLNNPRRGADAAAAHASPIQLNALYGGPGAADPDRNQNRKPAAQSNPGVMEQWRDRMASTLTEYFDSRRQEPADNGRLAGYSGSGNQAVDGRTVMRIVTKETLKFTREHVPEIDTFVKSLKVEFSSGRNGGLNVGEEAQTAGTGNKSIDTRAGGTGNGHRVSAAVQDKFVYKTGIRVRVESGKVGLVSETEAKYGKGTCFYRINLDNHGYNSMGLSYVLGKAASLQIERDFSRTMNPASRVQPGINVIRLGFNF